MKVDVVEQDIFNLNLKIQFSYLPSDLLLNPDRLIVLYLRNNNTLATSKTYCE